MGHLGMMKTKEMLRAKYWFPTMNSLVEQIVGRCFCCQVTTKLHRYEPVKTTRIPSKPWKEVAVDFGGPYADGHYNLVLIDKRTRYPGVQRINSRTCKPRLNRLRKIFATRGTPPRLDSDNGPPFTSHEFEQFAAEEGFKHHNVTPLYARANGETESFMKLLNKTEQISHLQQQDQYTRNQSLQICP